MEKSSNSRKGDVIYRSVYNMGVKTGWRIREILDDYGEMVKAIDIVYSKNTNSIHSIIVKVPSYQIPWSINLAHVENKFIKKNCKDIFRGLLA